MQPVSRVNEISLIAQREFKAQMFKKSTVIVNLVMAVLIVGGLLALNFFSQNANRDLPIGIDNPAAMPALSQMRSPDGQSGLTVKQMTRTEATADLLHGDDPIEAFIDTSKTPFEVVTANSLPRDLRQALTQAVQQQTIAKQFLELGGDPGALYSQVAAATPSFVTLKAQDKVDLTLIFLTTAMAILLFAMVVGAGNLVAMSVVEEKSSRIVEILLSTVRPSSLLAGKIIGAGVASILQTVALAAIAWVTSNALGMLDIGDVNLSLALLALVAWTVLGFAVYACLYAAAASLVSRQEDLAQAIMPLMFLVMIPYMFTVTVLPMNPNSDLARWLSYVPLFAPFLAPARVALGVSTTWDNLIAFAATILFLPLVVWVSGRLYEGAVLRTGGSVKLKDAWRRGA